MTPTVSTIRLPDEFSSRECLWFLDRGFYDCRYRIENNSVTKLLPVRRKLRLIRIHFYPKKLVVEIRGNQTPSVNPEFIVQHVRRWLDLDRDLEPFYRMAAADELLSNLIGKYRGLRLIGEPDLFETLCWAIIGQQINLSFAYKMKRNLVEAYGKRVLYNNLAYYAFPLPEVLADTTPDALKKFQLSRQKAEYIINLAEVFREGTMSREYLLMAPDFDSRKKMLMQIRGVGSWTANYALMRSLKEQEAFPHQDAGFLNAVKRQLKLQSKPTPEFIQTISKPWKGWEAYAVLYLWRSLADH